MSGQGYESSDVPQQSSGNSNLFQYQQDAINHYQYQQQQQHQQQVLPKVRNTAASGNSNYRQQSLNAAPATPRMLRNASNNVLNPSNNNLNDYHINTNFQLQQPQRQTTPSSTPQRTLSSPNPRPQDQLLVNQPRVHQHQQSHYTSPNTSTVPQQALSRLQLPVETPTKNLLLPPASVDTKSGKSEQDLTPHRASSQSHHSRGSSQKQLPVPQLKADGQFHRKSIGEWDFYKTIGAGSMGKVKLAKHRRTNELCAVKVVPRAEKIWLRQHGNDPPTTDSNELAKRMKEYEKEVARDRRTIREAALDKIMYHPYICRLYELIPMTNHYYMLFEYVSGGQMLDYIVSHGSLKERHARKFARGIASALDYCHSNNIVHRDLKIENIMISKTGEIKIIDFGLSNMYDRKSQLKTFCGSLYFAAPELLSAQPYLGPEVDIWSFGVVLYVLVCGKVPFDDQSVSTLHSKIKQGNVTYPDHLSWTCISLLQRMLVVNPAKRASLKEILNHKWMIDESEKPAYNYLPHRVPLSLPLSSEVIQEILSLQLGTEEQVINDLTETLTSQEYQDAVALWYAKRSGNGYASGDAYEYLDPTSGYSPLISIYYLVDEMQKRKKLKDLNNKSQLQQAQELRQKQLLEQQQQKTPVMNQGPFVAPHTPQKVQENVTPRAPVLSFPEAAYTASHGQGNFKDSTTASPQDEAASIPNQQANRSQSPKSRKTSNIDHALSSVKSQEDDANKSGFNSLLRKLSGKRSKQQYQQQPFNNNDFENLPPVPSFKSPSPTDSDGNFEHYEPQALHPPVDPLVRRVGSMKITSKEKELINAQLRQGFPPLPNKFEQQIQQHQRAVSTSASARKAKPTGVPTIETPTKAPVTSNTHKMHPSARAKSVGHVRKNSLLYNNNNSSNKGSATGTPPVPPVPQAYQDEGFFDDVSLNDDDYTNRRQESITDPKLMDLTEDQLINNFQNAPTGTMPSIEYPRTLFLKGFFSVQTTSTKPLPVIRNNIISVLSKLGVQFKEVKGGFICAHVPSITSAITTAPPDINIEIETGDHLETLESQDHLDKDAAASAPPAKIATTPRLSGSSNSSEIREPENTNEQLSLTSSLASSSPSATAKGHRRKFSLGNGLLRKKPEQPGRLNTNFSTTPNVFDTSNMPLTPAPANVHRHRHSHSINSTESQDSVDSLHEIKGASDMLISSRVDQMKSPTSAQKDSISEKGGKARSPLKFEIHIVKVPLVGLFGVQFKKLTGNTWMYKTLAGEILRELNL